MANYQCIKCGDMNYGQSGTPGPKSGGSCPSTPSGNHIWQVVSRFISFIKHYL